METPKQTFGTVVRRRLYGASFRALADSPSCKCSLLRPRPNPNDDTPPNKVTSQRHGEAARKSLAPECYMILLSFQGIDPTAERTEHLSRDCSALGYTRLLIVIIEIGVKALRKKNSA